MNLHAVKLTGSQISLKGKNPVWVTWIIEGEISEGNSN